jgi:hypothetical protein
MKPKLTKWPNSLTADDDYEDDKHNNNNNGGCDKINTVVIIV